jgi:hypothetical protein
MNVIDFDFEKDFRFSIRPSTIPKAGFGLFAENIIKKGEKLYVFGISIKKSSDINTCSNYARNYKFADPKDPERCIIPLNYAGMINQNSEDFKNATISNDGENLYFEFTRDINKNEEIFTYYGDGWCSIDSRMMAFINSKITQHKPDHI